MKSNLINLPLPPVTDFDPRDAEMRVIDADEIAVLWGAALPTNPREVKLPELERRRQQEEESPFDFLLWVPVGVFLIVFWIFVVRFLSRVPF